MQTSPVPTASRAFTLIEVLIAVGIIAVLTTVLMFSSGNSRAKARDARRISDVNQIRVALEGYFEQTAMGSQTYPTSIYSGTNSLVSTGMLPEVPRDPRTGAQYGYTAYASGGAGTCYANSAYPCKSYCLIVNLELDNPIRLSNASCSVSGFVSDTYLYPYKVSR